MIARILHRIVSRFRPPPPPPRPRREIVYELAELVMDNRGTLATAGKYFRIEDDEIDAAFEAQHEEGFRDPMFRLIRKHVWAAESQYAMRFMN